MRKYITLFLCVCIFLSCNRRLFVERINNGTHVKQIDAQVFNEIISESDLETRKEVVLSDEDGTGIIVRLAKDSTGNISVKTYVPQRTIVVKDTSTKIDVKEIERFSFRKKFLHPLLWIASGAIGLFFAYNIYYKKK